jgi:hypothetical protein
LSYKNRNNINKLRRVLQLRSQGLAALLNGMITRASSWSVATLLLLVAGAAQAQAPATPAASPAPAAGTSAGAGASASGAAADPKPAAKPPGNTQGYGWSDKKPTPQVAAPRRAWVPTRKGPVATLPGFEMLPGGGSRLFVDLSQAVAVEERKTDGTLTYVLKGAGLQHRNNANALYTVHFNTPVWRARLVPQGKDLLFVVEMRDKTSAAQTQMNPGAQGATRFTVDFPKGEFLQGGGPTDDVVQKMMTDKDAKP